MENKLKTHKGIAKRVKATKGKKLIHKKANNRHLLVNKGSANDKFKMGKQIHKSDAKSVKALLPYGAR